MASVACPRCNAKINELCRVDVLSTIKSPRRPILHQERREAWQQWKRQREKADQP